jgi:hypothetical protein
VNHEHWSRRRFIAATAASLAIAAVNPREAPGLEHVRGSWISFADLEPLRGERVRMVGPSGQVINARVIDVRDNTTTHRGVTVDQYSVLMRTGLSEPVEDHSFRLEHPTLGSCQLFCEPVLSMSRGIQYEATICRLAT